MALDLMNKSQAGAHVERYKMHVGCCKGLCAMIRVPPVIGEVVAPRVFTPGASRALCARSESKSTECPDVAPDGLSTRLRGQKPWKRWLPGPDSNQRPSG